MDADEYVKVRLEPQIDWYDSKSRTNKRLYLIVRVVEGVCAVFIPCAASLQVATPNGAHSINDILRLVTAALGIVVALCAGLASLFQFQEHWIKYRTTAESLKKEKYLYFTRGEPYATENPLPVLVQRVETLVSQENTNWAQYMMQPAKGAEHG